MEDKEILTFIDNLKKKLEKDNVDSQLVEQLGSVLVTLMEDAIQNPKKNMEDYIAYTEIYRGLLSLSESADIPVHFHSFYMGAGFALLNLYYLLAKKAAEDIVKDIKKLAERKMFYI